MNLSDVPTERKPVLRLHTVLSVISSPTRWRILREMANGDQVAVVELAERLGETPAGISKHMAVFRDSGMVNLGRNRLYSLGEQFIVDKEQRTVDFGWCVLRLNAKM